ncbi:hypothetical protein RDWZM_004340 [Blomia tropicalis]|uniref:Uncharacterized protein n=1 Tax=Blomia tropicalis TaxID=40697 RepID=A0A9Q0MGX6_BLOTA|nr:hypothetical protein BLOT_011595 [Blomia tropicalis]KAJ6225795.1 hypothetical protein RDWZM_004340 [Blomia tropicalis]
MLTKHSCLGYVLGTLFISMFDANKQPIKLESSNVGLIQQKEKQSSNINLDREDYEDMLKQDQPMSTWERFTDRLFGEPSGPQSELFGAVREKNKTLNRNFDESNGKENIDDKVRSYRSNVAFSDNSPLSMPVVLIFLLILVICISVVVIEANYNILEGAFQVINTEDSSIEEKLTKIGGSRSNKSHRKTKKSTRVDKSSDSEENSDQGNSNTKNKLRSKKRKKHQKKSRRSKRTLSTTNNKKRKKKKHRSNDESST